MTTKEQLIQAIEQAPDDLVEEVFNFLLFAQTRHGQNQSKPSLESDDIITQLQTIGNTLQSQHSGGTWEEAREAIARAQTRYAGQTFSDSTDLIREDRDR